MKGYTLHEPELWAHIGIRRKTLHYRFKIKRRWDEISDRVVDLLGKHSLIHGTRMHVVSVELSVYQEIVIEMISGVMWDIEDHAPLKQIFRSIRRHYC